MSVLDENNKMLNESKKEQLCIINKQTFATIAIIYVLLIIIYILKGSKRVLCITDQDEITKILTYNDELIKYTVLIVLIVTFYYLYQSIEDFEDTNSKKNRNYIIANTFSVLAAIIRFWNAHSEDEDLTEEEETEEVEEI